MKSVVLAVVGLALAFATQSQASSMQPCGWSNAPALTNAQGHNRSANFGARGSCFSHEAFTTSLPEVSAPAGWRGPILLVMAVWGPPTPWMQSASTFNRHWYGALAMHNHMMRGYRGGFWRGWDFDSNYCDIGLGHGHEGHVDPPAPAPVPLPNSGGLMALGLAALLYLGVSGRRRSIGGALA